MLKKTFLIEIGTEELPPKLLRNLAESFSINFTRRLENLGFSYGEVKWFATSRRLALKITNLPVYQKDRQVIKRGPSISNAFEIDNGKLSKSTKKWIQNLGITIDQTERLVTKKGEWLLYRANVQGKSAETLLPSAVVSSLAKLPIKKLMRWGGGDSLFVRPVRTVTLLLGDKVIPAEIFGIKSDRLIRGHRFMGEQEININNADQYPQILLERGKVIADYEKRKNKIRTNLEDFAKKFDGFVDLDDNLLEEVTSLVEWPVVLSAKFNERFLFIPNEVIVYTMKENLKYFPIYMKNGELSSNFIFVSNIESKNPTKIISGNERVLHARLEDAKFLFEADRKKRLENYLPSLKTTLFQQKLGTLYDKTSRIQILSAWIAEKIGANVNHVIRASLLSKCDLMTNMVFEFTNIQGIIGMHYARYDGEEEDVVTAISEQYQPRFSDDKIPSSLVSCSLSIADKIDSITGILGIGLRVKGNGDPFALRRASIGILRTLIEKEISLDLLDLVKKSVSLYKDKLTNTNVVNDAVDFMLNRLRFLYQNKGYNSNVIQSVLALKLTDPNDFDARVKAISYFCMLKEADEFILANKRILNILSKSNEASIGTVCFSVLKETAEISLAEKVYMLREKLQLLFSERNYKEALAELLTLCDPLDKFFRKVMVNVDDKNARLNRLALLKELRELFLQVADISLL